MDINKFIGEFWLLFRWNNWFLNWQHAAIGSFCRKMQGFCSNPSNENFILQCIMFPWCMMQNFMLILLLLLIRYQRTMFLIVLVLMGVSKISSSPSFSYQLLRKRKRKRVHDKSFNIMQKYSLIQQSRCLLASGNNGIVTNCTQEQVIV